MRYAYRDLGSFAEGSTAIVRWSGGAADVLLLDPVNFAKYRDGRDPVRYAAGGRFARAPAELTIPKDGRWYVVADLHGYSKDARPTVEVMGQDDTATGEEALATVG